MATLRRAATSSVKDAKAADGPPVCQQPRARDRGAGGVRVGKGVEASPRACGDELLTAGKARGATGAEVECVWRSRGSASSDAVSVHAQTRRLRRLRGVERGRRCATARSTQLMYAWRSIEACFS